MQAFSEVKFLIKTPVAVNSMIVLDTAVNLPQLLEQVRRQDDVLPAVFRLYLACHVVKYLTGLVTAKRGYVLSGNCLVSRLTQPGQVPGINRHVAYLPSG